MHDYASYADVYRQGPMAHVPAEIRPGGTWGAHLLRAEQPAHEVDEPATPDLHLDLYLDGRDGFSVERDLGDGMRRTKRSATRTIT